MATAAGLTLSLWFLARAGANEPAPAVGGRAPSGAWVCPHGGGRGWTASLFLANPGPDDSTARLTELGSKAPETSTEIEVPPGQTVRVPVTAADRGSATVVEYFGGWMGAGWVTGSAGRAEGIAAEPCADEASRRWFVADGSTRQEEDSFVVIANPFDAPAVLDVAIHSPDRAPVRDSEWTDLVVRPRRSVALRLDRKIEGETVAAVDLEVSVGRVAAASLVVGDDTRIRSALGSTATSAGTILPVIGGSGQVELIVFSVSDASIRFAATELSDEPPRPAGGLTGQDHGPLAAQAYAVPVDAGPAAVRVFPLDDASVAGALRALGPGEDLGSTAGDTAPAPTWLVFPALDRGPAEPSLVLVNDGDDAAVATLELLVGDGGTAAAPITVDVPPHAAAAVPPGFLASSPGSAVLVRSDGGDLVALASSSAPAGRREGGAYALSVGVPVPHRP
ncbi:MAG TPA: DUF5719 family protein [Actinomycetota bacterium]|nr:DUF5719 family protein [Actinomycetota bacterium]